ncbi:hypothetical protein [Streptomyces youssoufiensis]
MSDPTTPATALPAKTTFADLEPAFAVLDQMRADWGHLPPARIDIGATPWPWIDITLIHGRARALTAWRTALDIPADQVTWTWHATYTAGEAQTSIAGVRITLTGIAPPLVPPPPPRRWWRWGRP